MTLGDDAEMPPFAELGLDGLRRAVSARTPTTAPAETRGTDAVARVQRVLAARYDAGMTVAELAAAVGMTTRGLQDACQRAGGSTPMRMLRDARLRAAREELLTADPGGGNVQVVAARHGFGNPGRFAGYYRALFGVSPSQDLGGQSR